MPAMRPRTPRPLSHYGYRPDAAETERLRCPDCREWKHVTPGSRRCFDCATAHKAIDDSRKMPRPLYHGQVHHFAIEHLRPRGSKMDFRRPLTEGERDLGWLILPPFQRPPVWTEAQRIKLIESFWLDLPVGAYTYNTTDTFKHPCDLWLIDGQQRVGAVLAYLADEFPVFGYRFSELDDIERRQFEMKGFPAIKLTIEDAADLHDIYDRLAYGGTPHEPKDAT